MIRKEEIEFSENRCGGKGTLTVHKILASEDLNGHGMGATWIEFPPGTSIGHHQHNDSSEQYYVLEGEGLFDDNGVMIPIKAGETGVMNPGGWHGIENIGNATMKVIAIHTFS